MLCALRQALVVLGSLLASICVLASPPTYRVEMLDTGQFDAPSAELPSGGSLYLLAFISPNGRYVTAGIRSNDSAGQVEPDFLARLDRVTGTAEIVAGLERPVPYGINDDGAIALRALGTSAGAFQEMYYWSPATGSIPFGGPSSPATLSSQGANTATPRILNNFGQMLVRTSDSDAVLWNPIAGTQRILTLPAGDSGQVIAVSLNNLGQVVGGISYPTSVPNEVDVRPFIWDETSGLRLLLDLELISPNVSPFMNFGRFAIANAINDAGAIAGETRDESYDLLGLHWDSEATLPTLLPCPPGSTPCAVWMLNDAGDFIGGEEQAEEIVRHYVWDGTQPYLLRDLIVEGPNVCQIHAISNDGTLAGTCGGTTPALVIPITTGPQLNVTTPEPGATVPAGPVQVEGLATDDIHVVSVTVNGAPAVLTPTGNPQDPNEVAFSIAALLAPGDQLIEVVATDSDGNVEIVDVAVNVVVPDGQGPVVSDVVADPNPAPVSSTVRLTALINDTATGGSAIAAVHYIIDGGPPIAMSAADGAFDETQESVVADIAGFPDPGVYEVCVTGSDIVGNVSAPACALVAVFDPSGGFVTGGGRIGVPAGVYPSEPASSGRINFGFVAKYKKGSVVPTGSTELQFKPGRLNFHSSAYDWLVVSDGTARLQGWGTVNGDPSPSGLPYRFLLTARDGTPDSVGMRIWWDGPAGETTVFDLGTRALDGGSIVIHK